MSEGSRIAVLLPDLRGGGAERVILLLLREFLARGNAIDLVLLKNRGVLLEQVPPEVRIIDLGADRIRNGFIPFVRYLRRVGPDSVLASLWPLTTLAVLAAKLARFPGRVVVTEHNALSRSARSGGFAGAALRASMRWINERADAVVGVSSGVVDDLQELGLPPGVATVIYNPIAIASDSEIPDTWSGHPWLERPRDLRLMAVGRLKEQKDYFTLLSAVRKVVDSGIDVSLLILGDGSLHDELEDRRRALRLADHVNFGGFVPDPSPFYRAARVFVLSSAWEGFGNVIVEALAAGTPVVSTDCHSGPAEILEGGRYGRLVPVGDDEALASAICESLVADANPDILRSRAADFSVGKVGTQYLEVLTP